MRSGLRRLMNQAARPPVPLVRSQQGMLALLSQAAADPVTCMQAFGRVGTIHGMMSLLAPSTARCEWKLFRKQPRDARVRYSTSDTGSDNRVEVVQHAALNLWNRPNPFQTGFVFREMSQLYLDLTGEMPWLIGRNPASKLPLTMWTVRPDRLAPVPSAETYLAGYVYTGPTGEKVPLGVDDVIVTKLPNPLDPLRGLGPVQSMLTDAGNYRAAAEWNQAFFANGAEPGGVITSPERMDDTEFDEFQLRWAETHRGVSRAHRVALLENMTWTPNAMSQRDMEFVAGRDQARDVMRETLGIHKVMMGVSDDVNRANAQTGEEVFESWKIVPRLDRTRDTLNNYLLPMYEPVPTVEFDYQTPVPANREQDNQELLAKCNATLFLVQAGADLHDALEAVGLPDMTAAEVQTAANPDDQGTPESEGSAASQTPIPGETEGAQNAIRRFRELAVWNSGAGVG